MNPLVYMMIACSMARARNPRDLMKLGMIALTLMSMEDTEWMPASSSSWSNRNYPNGMRRKIGFYLLSSLRNAPTGDLDHHQCPLIHTIEKGSDQEFRQTFRVSRFVFAAILNELKADLQDGFSRNRGQNVSAELKLGVALFYMAHGGGGMHLRKASGLSIATALKYVYDVSKLINEKLGPKFMGDAILQSDGYLDDVRARFHARNGYPNVAGCIDGTHIPYKPNFGEHEADFKNYKQWTSLLCIAFVNSQHLFVDIDVGWPGRWHDKTCADNSRFWLQMHRDRDAWMGSDGVILADSAWSPGSTFVMAPYTVFDGSTEAQQWYNFVHSSTRFFVEETFGRWKNRFRCLLKQMEMSNSNCKSIIFATAVLHNVCTIMNDVEKEYFDGTDGGIRFPRSPLDIYQERYPLDKIICPRCKKRSNGAIACGTQPLTCNCHNTPFLDRLDRQATTSMYARFPQLRQQLVSSDPIIRREAHCNLFYHFKPRNF
jgi:hypothetical protein